MADFTWRDGFVAARHSSSLQRFRSANPLKIGILGGSFNPAHQGHLHISEAALKQLGLDYVWWLVSPANPFKDPTSLAGFDVRLRVAESLVKHPRIIVSDYEQRNRLRYTVDTLNLLHKDFPQHRFVWLMGSDNLPHFHRWEGWERIVHTTPIAIFDRAPFTHEVRHAHFCLRYGHRRKAAPLLVSATPPAWDVMFIRRHAESATHLRKTLGEKAFLGYN